jgi:hypothetical protein
MKRTAVLFVLVVAAALVLSGCPNMFTMNLFAGLSGPQKPDVTKLREMPEEDAIQQLSEDATSPQFYENLENDEDQGGTAKEELLGYLGEVYSDDDDDDGDGVGGVDTPEEQKAALLAADVHLKTTDGDKVVDNVVSTVLTLMDEGSAEDDGEHGDGDATDGGTEEDPVKQAQDVMKSLFQNEDGTDPSPEDFTKTLDALAKAADAYKAFGSSLKQDPDTGEWNAPEGTNLGSVAQSAMVSVAADAAVKLVDDDPQVLYDFIYEGEEPKDEAGESKISSPEDVFADLENDTSVLNIMEAGGYGALLEGLTGQEEGV